MEIFQINFLDTLERGLNFGIFVLYKCWVYLLKKIDAKHHMVPDLVILLILSTKTCI